MRYARPVVVAVLFAFALPVASASAADPVIANHQVLGGIAALDGNLVYKRKTKKGKPAVCMRRVGGKLVRATRLPLSACPGFGDMGLDGQGRVILPFQRYRIKHGVPGSVRWYVYDVKSDRVRPVKGLPGGLCISDKVLIWGTRMVYGVSCSSKKGNGVWVKDGKKTRRILASAALVEGLVLRGGTLAGWVPVGANEGQFEVYQLLVGGKPCVRPIESSLDNSENEEIFGLWIANGKIVWSRGYYPGGTAGLPSYKGLFTSKVPSHCAAPGPNGRFEFNPETASLWALALDGRQVYYAGKKSIRRHTLPAQPSYAPPANDNFENAQSVPVDGQAYTPGSTAWATTQAGEPLANDKQTIWYTFTPTTSGTLYVSVDSGYRFASDVQFGAYTGTSLATLTPVGGPSSPPASIQFNAVAGQQYWVDIGTSDAQANYIPLSVRVATTPH
jgi:hypothetical protein